MQQSISSTERYTRILHHITSNGRISLSEVCALFSISPATARRDLELLATAGKLQRVHGGAIALPQPSPEQPILQRTSENSEAKQLIGRTAAALISDGETVFLGSGTTVLETARALRERSNLTVITNSLPVINTLAGVETITLVCLGGMLRESELSFIGHITEQALAEVRADKVIIGTRAVSLDHGLMNEYLPETLTDRAILKAGHEVIVLADHTKLGHSAAVLLAPLETVNTFVTDEQGAPEFLVQLRSRGITVVTARHEFLPTKG